MRFFCQRVDEPLDLGQTQTPEIAVAHVEPERADRLGWGDRAAQLQQLYVIGDERAAAPAVEPVEGQYEQLAEGVRVAVEAGVDEVRDVRPAKLVALRQLE